MARLTPLLTKGLLLLALVVLMPSDVLAQVGEHRNELSVGVNGGYVMSNVGYVNKIPQLLHKGLTGGLSFRYTSEKYFNSICAVVAEVNFAQIGWKENILDENIFLKVLTYPYAWMEVIYQGPCMVSLRQKRA